METHHARMMFPYFSQKPPVCAYMFNVQLLKTGCPKSINRVPMIKVNLLSVPDNLPYS